jgi:hypothetical protein
MHAVIHQCLIAIIEVGYGCIPIIALGQDSRIVAWVVRLTCSNPLVKDRAIRKGRIHF